MDALVRLGFEVSFVSMQAEACIAEDADALARLILALHADRGRNAHLALAGRAILRDGWSARAVEAAFARAIGPGFTDGAAVRAPAPRRGVR
ncbi:MAG TPA: hypothetical protein VMU82_02605 [Acetobacteraceae bacterium]|nr:hypothetical protein [Acetobacteraceae bacterium]